MDNDSSQENTGVTRVIIIRFSNLSILTHTSGVALGMAMAFVSWSAPLSRLDELTCGPHRMKLRLCIQTLFKPTELNFKFK